MLDITWMKCVGDKECGFEALNLSHEHFDNCEGVYLIYYNGIDADPGRVVRAGQGVIRDRIAAHRKDPKILAYTGKGLKVTWAKIPADKRDGVERYLSVAFNPLIGDRFPDRVSIEVNCPWD